MAGRFTKQGELLQIERLNQNLYDLSKQVAMLAEWKELALKSSGNYSEQAELSYGNARTGEFEKRLDRLIRLKEVLEIVPVSKSTWWSWVAKGIAVKPVRLGRCTCWKYSEILEFTAKKGL